MNREQFLLIKLAEECQEVAQRALKTAQFGKDEVQKDQPFTNGERLAGEVIDVLAAIKMLTDIGYDFDLDNMEQRGIVKIEKVEKYYAYSKSLGKVE